MNKTETSYKTIEHSYNNSYGILYLNAPDQMNAMSPLMIEELFHFFNTPPQKEIRFLVISGRGKCFGAGGDLKSMFQMSESDACNISKRAHETFASIKHYPIPVTAIVHGYAIGGGFELALACDLIFAAADSWFSLPELKYGMLPGGGGSVRLVQAIGSQNAFWKMITGDKLSAEEALNRGIVQQILNSPDYLSEAISILQKVLSPIERESVSKLKEVISEASAYPKKAYETEATHFSYLLNKYAKSKIEEFINKTPAQ